MKTASERKARCRPLTPGRSTLSRRKRHAPARSSQSREDMMGITTTNADGRPAVALTEDQRYLFDTRGWLAIPGVLSEREIESMREFCYRLRREPEALAEH